MLSLLNLITEASNKMAKVNESTLVKIRPLFTKLMNAYELDGTQQFEVPMYAGVAERTLRIALKELLANYAASYKEVGLELELTAIAVSANHKTKTLTITLKKQSFLSFDVTPIAKD